MKKCFSMALALLTAFAATSLTACSEDDNTVEEYQNWEQRNIAYFDSIYNVALQNSDGQWDTIRCWSMNESAVLPRTSYIVVHKEETGTGSGCPMYTDSVIVQNQGKLLPSTSYPYGKLIEQSYEGDFSNYNPLTATKKKWYVGGLVDGYTTALQRMHIGDRWRVYMPWTLAYGTADYNSIPGYSVLIWDIKLLGYYHPGADIPGLDAKEHSANVWTME